MYLLRLDDASEYMDIEKWSRMEKLLRNYNVKPIVGVIPNNKDLDFLKKYSYNKDFWDLVRQWKNNGWEIAMHGYQHKFVSTEMGMNPINIYSEFAGVNYKKQCEKIRKGYSIMKSQHIIPNIFFAPAHTFDSNTLKALKKETSIHYIVDTIAYDIYFKDNIFFIPQQTGIFRRLPLKIVTACYHPNNMSEADFFKLEHFIRKNRKKMASFIDLSFKKRHFNFRDYILKKIYFDVRKVKRFVKRN